MNAVNKETVVSALPVVETSLQFVTLFFLGVSTCLGRWFLKLAIK